MSDVVSMVLKAARHMICYDRFWAEAGGRKAAIAFALLGLLAVGGSTTRAASATLAWNSNSESSLSGYRLYYGTSSRNYSANVQVGKTATSATVNTLVSGQTYYFAVTAFDTSNVESDYSAEVSYTPTSPNVAPTLNAVGNVTISEDAGAQTVNLSGITSGSSLENQTLTVSAVSSNPSLIPNPSVSYSSPNATGTLSFTPVANAFGSAAITVTVNDGQSANNTFSRVFTVNVNAVNDTPTLGALNNQSVVEDAPAQTITLSGIGTGAANETQTLTVTATSSTPGVVPAPTVSYTSPNSTGTLTFTPAANAVGSSTITVTVNDGQSQNNLFSRTFTVTVGAVNDAPSIAALNNLSINEDAGAQTVNLSGISPGAGETQTLTVTATSSNPSLIPNPTVTYSSPSATGSLSFTPAANRSGSAIVTVTVNDGQSVNNLATRTFTVTVAPINDAPTLGALSDVSVAEDASVQTVGLTGIGTGASDESQTLTVTATSSNPGLIPNPTVSYTSPNSTGSLTFTPVANGNGTSVITVTVNDGQALSNTVSRTFTVTVNPVNDGPTLAAISNLTMAEDASPQTVTLAGIGTGSGNEFQTLTVSAVSSNPGVVPNPSVTYLSPSATGTLSVTPAPNGNGTATITVTVNDGQSSANLVTRTFTVTVSAVNDTPTLDSIANISLPASAPAQTVNLTGLGTGAANENQTLVVTATSSNPSLVPNPTVNYTSPNSTGTLVFTPVAATGGSAIITVTVNDGQSQNNLFTRTFTVSVAAGNAPPTLGAIADRTVLEDAGLQTVNLSGISSGLPTEDQPLTLTVVSSNPGLIPTPTLNYTSPNSTAALSFTPTPNANGTAVVTVTVDDGQSVNNTFSRSFTVTVTADNDVPTLAAISDVSVNEDAGAQTVNLTGIGSGAANEIQALGVTAVSSNPGLIPNPAITYNTPNTTGTLVFTPVANASGSAVITVTVNDGQAQNNTVIRTFTVTVGAINDPPTLGSISNVSINEDAGQQTVNLTGIGGGQGEGQNVTITATSSNPALIPHPAVIFANPNSTGTLLFTPVANSNGTATITVTVDDSQSQNNTATRTFTVTVNAVNDAPVLDPLADLALNVSASAQTVNLSGIGSGAINETQTLTVTASSSNPDLIPNPTVSYTSPNATGTLSFTPAPGSNGTAMVTVTVNDGQAQNNLYSRTFRVTVASGNRPPTINPLTDIVLNEDAPQQLVNFSGISAGPGESQTLTVTAVSSDPALIPQPTVRYSSPVSGGYFTFTPTPGAFGSAWITVTVDDGQSVNNTASRIIRVTVNPVNDVPTLNPISDQDLQEDSGPRVVQLTGISTGSTNEDQALVLTAVSSNPSVIPHPEVGYVSPSATGTLTLIPATNVVGSATITVTLNDGATSQNTVTRTFYVAVRGINDPPVFSPVADQAIPGDQSTGPIPFTVSDPDTSMVNVRVSAASSDTTLIPSGGLVLAGTNNNRTITVTPAAGRSGVATVTLSATDGYTTNTEAFVVTVGENQSPTLSLIADQVVDSSTTLTNVAFQVNDVETPAASLQVEATSSDQAIVPDSGIEVSGSGINRRLSITPAKGRTGQVDIAVMVSDGIRETQRSFKVNVRTYKSRLVINKRGRGKVEPDLNGQQLIVGQRYSITATPDAGDYFEAWDGGVAGTNAVLTFVMVPNMTINARFATDPYWASQGNYTGLILESDEVRHERSGSFTFSATSRGSYSGKLQIGSGKYSVKGQLERDGRATNVVARVGLASLTIKFAVDAENPGQVTGDVTDGSWTAGLLGDRQFYSSKTNPAPFAGSYTLVIPADPSGSPRGAGYGTIKVDANGVASFVGMLADGSKATAKAPLSSEGSWPFYISLYRGGGSAIGWLTLQPTDGDITGLLSWIKPAIVSKYYAAGVTNESQVVGGAYVPPAPNTGDTKDTDIVFSGGNLSEAVIGNLQVLPNGKMITQAGGAVKFGLSPTTGLFKGTVLDPETNKPRAFSGVLLQKWDIGAGLILGLDEIGLVELSQ